MSQPFHQSTNTNGNQVWDLLNPSLSEELDLPGNHFSCNGCSKEVGKTFYNFKANDDDLFQFCKKCFVHVDQHLDRMVSRELTQIDQSTEDKPLRWSCICCGTKLGGGHTWKLYRDRYDLCNACDLSVIKSKFELLRNVVVVERNDPVLVSLAPVPNRTIPSSLVQEVTEERVHVWIEILTESIVSIPSVGVFGSLLQWVPICDRYELDSVVATTMLLVDCSVETNGRVASLVEDDHGRAAINIVYANVEEYQKAYTEWLKTNNKDMTQSHHTEFSGYVRLFHKLGTDYS